MEFDRSDLRKLIYYGWKRGLNGVQICNEISDALGDGFQSVSVRTCQYWITKFKDGDFSVEDKERHGRPSLEGVNKRIEECLVEDKHVTLRQIASYLDCSPATVLRHMKSLGKKYLAYRWIPHTLTEENKNNRMAICAQNLDALRRNNFLNQLITVDESWIFWDNKGNVPGSHHKSWRGSGDEAPFVTKQTAMTTRKHLAIVFWDAKGVILYKTLPRNVTINAELYCETLDELKINLQEKRRRIANQGFQNFHFLHDNARPHTARITQEKLRDMGFTVLPHPPYSPDLAPSDYYLFSSMKAGLKGGNFNSANEVNNAIQRWMDDKPQEFFRKGIHLLTDRWTKCVAANGNYFQRLRNDDIDDNDE